MNEMQLSIVEPFTSPTWGSRFVVFSSNTGTPIPEDRVQEYLARCCKYAKLHGVWLVPERFVFSRSQCMCIINPGGKALGAQKAIYSSPSFKLPTEEKNTDIDVVSTEFGGVFLCVDADVYHPEVCCIACGMGAQIIICSQTIRREDYSSHMVLNGAWNAAQLTGACVIAVSDQFNCVSVPIDATPARDGFLNPPSLKMPMTQKIRVSGNDRLRRPKPLNRRFYAIHRKELVKADAPD